MVKAAFLKAKMNPRKTMDYSKFRVSG